MMNMNSDDNLPLHASANHVNCQRSNLFKQSILGDHAVAMATHPFLFFPPLSLSPSVVIKSEAAQTQVFVCVPHPEPVVSDK